MLRPIVQIEPAAAQGAMLGLLRSSSCFQRLFGVFVGQDFKPELSQFVALPIDGTLDEAAFLQPSPMCSAGQKRVAVSYVAQGFDGGGLVGVRGDFSDFHGLVVRVDGISCAGIRGNGAFVVASPGFAQ